MPDTERNITRGISSINYVREESVTRADGEQYNERETSGTRRITRDYEEFEW